MSEQNVETIKNNQFIGCNEAQVNKVHEMLTAGRRYFGSSGASLTHQVSNPAYKEKFQELKDNADEALSMDPGLAQAGLDGERRTTVLLREWISKHPGAVLIDSVHVKGYGKEEYDEESGVFEGGDTDHVLILGNTVIIIDSKNWKSKRKYSINDKGAVIRGKTAFPGGRLNTVRASRLWMRYLRPHRVAVSSIVCISSEKVFVVRDVNWWKQPFRLLTLETLEEFLDKVWESLPDNTKGVINTNLITSIAVNSIKPFDPVKELLGEVSYLLEPGKEQ